MSETPTTPAPELLSAERLAAPRLTPTQARKALLNGIIRARIGTKASPIPNNDLQNVVELLTYQEAHVTAQAAALQAAEARAAEAEAQVAMLRVELAEQERELSYERQMRQQTEEAMVKLADRVKEERADADRFQVQVLTLMRRELFLMRLLNEAQHALKQLFGPKMPSMETIRGLAHDTHTSLCQADPLLGSKCAKCQGVVNAYGQCFYCDTTEPGLCN